MLFVIGHSSVDVLSDRKLLKCTAIIFMSNFAPISFIIVLMIPPGLKTNNDSIWLWMIFDHAIRRVLIIKPTRVFDSKIDFFFCDFVRSEKAIF